MLKIANIASSAATPKTARWVVPTWNGDNPPYLDYRPANPTNAAYTAAHLELAKSEEAEALRRRGVKGLTVAKLDANREKEYEIFAKTVVAGWGNLFDDDGKPIEFIASDPARTEAVLRALGPTNFDDFRDKARGHAHEGVDALGKP